MKLISLVPIGQADRRRLASVATAVSRTYGVPCNIVRAEIDPARTFHPERRQYHSTELLDLLSTLNLPGRTLGITNLDLYIPILTYVFGEAHLQGQCALVSSHRLSETFYGLPYDEDLTTARLVKTAIHEVGHTYGLTHCDDYDCVMAAAHAVEWIDLKSDALCETCRSQCLTVSYS